MDRPRTLEVLDTLIEPTGGVALFQESYPEVPFNDWHPSFQAILDYYGAGDPARNRTHDNKDHETVLLASAFSHLERIAVLERRSTSVEHLVDRSLSYARAWEGRPGSRLKDMALEVRDALQPYATNGHVPEVTGGYRADRPPPGCGCLIMAGQGHLQIEIVSKQFRVNGAVLGALDSVDLSVAPGEF